MCVSGPNVMAGYWNKPEANAAAFNADGSPRTETGKARISPGLPS